MFKSLLKKALDRPSILAHSSDRQSEPVGDESGLFRPGYFSPGTEIVRDNNGHSSKSSDFSYIVVGTDTEWDDEFKLPSTDGLTDATVAGKERRGSAQKVLGEEVTLGERVQRKAHIGTLRQSRVGRWVLDSCSRLHVFFNQSFADEKLERAYQRESYESQQAISLAASTFFLVTWAVIVGTMPRPFSTYDWYAWFGIYGFFTLPLVPMILCNCRYRIHHTYQFWLFCSTWALPIIGDIEMYTCGFGDAGTMCDARKFLIIFASAIGKPTLSQLACGQTRPWSVAGFLGFFVIMAVFFFNGPRVDLSFYRNAVYFLIYHIFLNIICYIQEKSSRQLFAVRRQLAKQYRETQRAQVAEKNAADMKKRFVSYIFHEVRVPLNTALLSVQNLKDDGALSSGNTEQAELTTGLTSSLSMMEKVLNDVLSFDRMESGKFKLVCVPFDFHSIIQLAAKATTPCAQTKGLRLETSLDSRIDCDAGGRFIGDEMRLNQITLNLLSNAVKFTSKGSVKITTKLTYLSPYPTLAIEDSETRPVNVDLEKGLNLHPRPPCGKGRYAVVRVEIQDTGAGLKKEDIEGGFLFSPYVQTEIGRRQGGKGTGLGLALVRQIVEISKGRLGVDSSYGNGSTFWFELPYLIDPSRGKKSSQDMSVSGSADSSTLAGSGSDKGYQKGPMTSSVIMESPLDIGESGDLCEKEHIGLGDLKVIGKSMTPKSESKPATAEILSSSNPIDNTRATSDVIIDGFNRTSDPPLGQRANTMPQLQSSQPVSTLASSPMTPTASQITNKSIDESPLDVLIVDDDKLTRTLMSKMLKRLGHRVTTAEHGQMAFEMINNAFRLEPDQPRIDIIFLDNQMPFMTGAEVAKATRKDGNPIYISGCTGNALKEDQEEYLRAGADMILTKPIKVAGIEEAIRNARKRLAGETVPKVWD